MQQPLIGDKFIKLLTADSTNNYAMQQIYDGKAVHGNAYLALQQTNGRGQMGKFWHSGKDNLALSIIFEPYFLNLSNPFLLQTFISVSLCQLLNAKMNGFEIKWPNDIYFNDRKAAGILIENNIVGNTWKFAVIGLGINLNFAASDNNILRSIYLSEIIEKEVNVEIFAAELLQHLEVNWQVFIFDTLIFYKIYNELLYKKNKIVKLKKENKIFEIILKSVSPLGALICGENNEFEFKHGEVEFIFD